MGTNEKCWHCGQDWPAKPETVSAPTPDLIEPLTYANQPGNVDAWKLGEACRDAAAEPKCGDFIDRGLILLRELQAKGFGIVKVPRDQARPSSPALTDEQIDKIIAKSSVPFVSYGESYWDVDGLIRKADLREMVRAALTAPAPAERISVLETQVADLQRRLEKAQDALSRLQYPDNTGQ